MECNRLCLCGKIKASKSVGPFDIKISLWQATKIWVEFKIKNFKDSEGTVWRFSEDAKYKYPNQAGSCQKIKDAWNQSKSVWTFADELSASN